MEFNKDILKIDPEAEAEKICQFIREMTFKKFKRKEAVIGLSGGIDSAEEIYGLASQARRAAISIPSNIAEGYQRGSRKECVQFLNIAYGSAAKLETQLSLAHDLDMLAGDDYRKTMGYTRKCPNSYLL